MAVLNISTFLGEKVLNMQSLQSGRGPILVSRLVVQEVQLEKRKISKIQN